MRKLTDFVINALLLMIVLSAASLFVAGVLLAYFITSRIG